MSNFVDKALIVFKGEEYIKYVKELGLIDRSKYDSTIKIMNNFLHSGVEGYQKDVEEFAMLASVFTETFYHMNTFQKDVLKDIKFYSENLLNIIRYLYDDSVNEVIIFKECSDGLKNIDTENIYKEVISVNSDKQDYELAMLKGKLCFALFVTILENNNSGEYIRVEEK